MIFNTHPRAICSMVALFLFWSFTPLSSQDLQITTRFDYYTQEPTCTLILFGNDIATVKSLRWRDQTLPETSSGKGRRLFQLPIFSFGEGQTEGSITAHLVDGTKTQIAFTLTKLSPYSNTVQVDRLTGGLWVNSRPFYPFGFYTGYPMGNLPTNEVYHAMNLIGVYQSNVDSTLQGRKAYMDRCAALGIKVNYSVNSLIGTPHNQTDHVITAEEEAQRWAVLKKEIETFRNHPALLAWYMNDEPIGQGRSPALLEKAYRLIKELDPYHPVSVVFVMPERAAAFGNCMDIAMTDPYPVPGDIRSVATHMQALRKHFQYQKALWLVPQAFGGGEFWPREPTGPELRAMTWLGLVEGAMGMQYFIRRAPNLFPKSQLAWKEAVQAAHEFQALLPWLSATEERVSLSTEDAYLSVMVYPRADDHLLVLVNTENRPKTFRVNIGAFAQTKDQRIQLPLENRAVDLQRFVLTEPIEAYGRRVYLIHAEEATPEHSYNLFSNPGFEYAPSPGVPFGCYANSDRRPLVDGSTYFVDGSVSHTGDYALRIRTVEEESHLSLAFYRMMVEKNRPYRCSFWSKGESYASPSKFTISIPELNWTKTFHTTGEWQLHQFYFTTEAQSTALRWQIDVRGKQLLWLDDISVVPEPVVAVEVTKGPLAVVTLQRSDTTTQLSYRTDPNTAYQPYRQPIRLQSYTDLDILMQHQTEEDQHMQIAIPLSKATRASVELLTAPSEKYEANGPATLTDGQLSSLAFKDGKCLGFAGQDVSFIVDLGAPQQIQKAQLHSLVSVKDGIHAPVALRVDYAERLGDFYLLGDQSNAEGSRHGDPYHLTLKVNSKPVTARYLRYTLKSPVQIPEGYLFAGTDAWLFIDEILVQ